MSVVVRMEMPKDKNCLLNFSLPKIGPWCWIEDRACDYYKTNNRPDWCPILCQLPEGHGDLIDRSVLLSTFDNADYETYNDYCEAFDTTEAAETIVPAEAERSET